MNILLDVKKLSKIYQDKSNKVTALDDVSFSLNEGEELAIAGPSGSGKTTLLQLIGGLDRPTAGSVFINGINIAEKSDKEVSEFRNKTLGFIFQMMHLQDYLTALENVMLPALAAGKNRQKARRKAKDLLDMVGLSSRRNHKPNELSGGEMQRVAVARALINDPKIVMADEPTGKLDKANSEKIIDLLDDVSRKRGVSVVLITHDLSITKRFPRVISLSHGKLESDTKN